MLRSSDTLSDDRVDPKLCQALGIRSLAVPPLLGVRDAVGILEVFSLDAHAFKERDVKYLKLLAAITAWHTTTFTNSALPARHRPSETMHARGGADSAA